MGNYTPTQLTTKGDDLKNQILIGNGILEFTRMAIGSGQVAGNDYSSLESLVDEITEIIVEITGRRVGEDGHLEVIGKYSNENIETSLYVNEIGLFAKDLDGNEILYSYTSAHGEGDYIGTRDTTVIFEDLEFETYIGDVQNFIIHITKPTNAVDVDLNIDVLEAENVEEALIELNGKIVNKPNVRLTTVVHNLVYYPVIQVLSTKGAYGIGGFGELPFGGYETITEVTRQKHNDRNSFELLVSEDLAFENPVLNVVSEGYEYCITFDNTDTSLVVLLSSVQKTIVDDNGDETIEIDTYTKEEIDYKNGSSTFIVHVNGGQKNWNSNDPNTSYFPPTTNTWYDIPAKFSHLVDANNSKSYKFYTNFEYGDSEVALVNDIAEKVERIEFEIMCFLQNQLWYNTTVRLIAHKPSVSSTEYLGNSLGFSENTVLLAQRDFVASNGQRTASVSSRSLRTLLRDSETGALIDRNGWILRFQILTDNTQDYISDKSYVGITFIHKK